MNIEDLQLIDTKTVLGLVGLKDHRVLRRMYRDGEFPKPVIDKRRCQRWAVRSIAAWIKRRESAS